MTILEKDIKTIASLDKDGLRPYLKSLPIFANISESLLGNFADHALPFEMETGEALFSQEDKVEYFYLILSGWVKVFRTTQDGNEAVFDMLTTSQLCGETAILDGEDYNYNASVVEDITGYKFPVNILRTAIETDVDMAYSMLKSVINYSKLQAREIESLTLQNASQRIGCYLLRLCRVGVENPVAIRLPYDKSMIAARLGMRPETFSRALKKLKDKVDMQIDGSLVTVPSIHQLSDFTCAGCSSEYPCADLKKRA